MSQILPSHSLSRLVGQLPDFLARRPTWHSRPVDIRAYNDQNAARLAQSYTTMSDRDAISSIQDCEVSRTSRARQFAMTHVPNVTQPNGRKLWRLRIHK